MMLKNKRGYKCDHCEKTTTNFLKDKGWIDMMGSKSPDVEITISTGIRNYSVGSMGPLVFCSLKCLNKYFDELYDRAYKYAPQDLSLKEKVLDIVWKTHYDEEIPYSLGE